MDISNVEHIVASLVREFLSRKKCKNTLALMDEELPRDSKSINNRSKLTEILHLQKWMAANKSMKTPLRSMLEVIVYNSAMLNQPVQTNDRCATSSHLSSTMSTSSSVSALNSKVPISVADDVTNSVKKMELEEIDDLDLNAIDSYKLSFKPTKIVTQPKPAKVYKNPEKNLNGNALFPTQNTKMSPLVNDMNLDADFKRKNQQKEESVLKMLAANSELSPKKRPIKQRGIHHNIGDKILNHNDLEQVFTIETAGRLQKLVFGTQKHGFPKEWLDQSFSFDNTWHERSDMLRFGILQKKGGPCGVLAAVQAMVLKHLLFSTEQLAKNINEQGLDVNNQTRTLCLAEAITDILWKAGNKNHAILAVRTPRKQLECDSWFKPDGLTENIVILNFNTIEKLRKAVMDNIAGYENGKGSCILLLYSAILSRGIENIETDMMGQKLIESHNYCSQDMVNLMLTGRATANVFNDVITLDKDTKLTGIHEQSEIGLLTLFEHYKSCEVGSYYKTPTYPIWVICSESHYSVLFGLDFNLQSQPKFDLYYYDGLANQDELIKLTVDTTNKVNEYLLNGDLVPPLEHCIRTKWQRASIDWNGTDPIL